MMRVHPVDRCTCVILLTLVVTAGCMTHARRASDIRSAFYRSDLSAANESLDRALNRKHFDADVLILDRAMVQLAGGEMKEAEQSLRTVRDHFDHLEQLDAGEAAWSYLTDDQRRAYAGEDYEKVLIRVFLALSNLLDDGSDAEAYLRQAIDKQQQIVASLESDEVDISAYPGVAAAPYLYGVLRESTHRDYDDALRGYELAGYWQPDFAGGRADWQRASQGRHSAPGNGVVYIIALTGRGPYKEESVETPSSAALLIAGEMLSASGKQTVPPSVAPVKVPRLVARPSNVQRVEVAVNEQFVGATSTITDVTSLAIQQYEAAFPRIVARAVFRRCCKKAIVYGAKEVTDLQRDSLMNFAVDMAGVAWEFTESADTRCWALLPDKIQILRVELPAGRHQLHLQPMSAAGPCGPTDGPHDVIVDDGRNTYVMAIYADGERVGELGQSR